MLIVVKIQKDFIRKDLNEIIPTQEIVKEEINDPLINYLVADCDDIQSNNFMLEESKESELDCILSLNYIKDSITKN